MVALGDEIVKVIGKEPLYFTDIAENFARYDFRPSPGPSATCTRPKSSGKTRVAGSACAARSSQRSRRKNNFPPPR